MKKILLPIILLVLTVTLGQSQVSAGTSCQPIYGGGQTCVTSGDITINKAVLNPATNQMVENLGINDPKYQADGVVTFGITIRNTGGARLNTITLKDILPQYVSYLSGGTSYDAGSKTLTINTDGLNAGESRSFTIQGKVVTSAELPQADGGSVCVVNQAIVTADAMTAQDNAQLCIEKKVLAATTKGGKPVFPQPKVVTTPPTGPEMLPLLALIPGGLLGQFLRKKSDKI